VLPASRPPFCCCLRRGTPSQFLGGGASSTQREDVRYGGDNGSMMLGAVRYCTRMGRTPASVLQPLCKSGATSPCHHRLHAHPSCPLRHRGTDLPWCKQRSTEGRAPAPCSPSGIWPSVGESAANGSHTSPRRNANRCAAMHQPKVLSECVKHAQKKGKQTKLRKVKECEAKG